MNAKKREMSIRVIMVMLLSGGVLRCRSPETAHIPPLRHVSGFFLVGKGLYLRLIVLIRDA